MRKLALFFSALVVIGLAALLFRVQPSGTATVFRSGRRVITLWTPVYIRPLGSTSCRVKTLGADRLSFEADEPVVSSTNDEFGIHIRFGYAPPSMILADWPAGDWCTSLEKHVGAVAAMAASRFGAMDLIDRRRETSDRIAERIEKELHGIATSVSARIDLPSGFERLRSVAEVSKATHAARPVIFIGLDGADWQLLDDYMASGAMPNLKRLVTTGAAGPLETEHPPLSPLVWTTMMTGVGPLRHQILDFVRFNPYTHEKEPITSDERRAPAIWNMLTDGGKQAAVFGLWATYAAEPVHAVNVSDRLFTFLYTDVRRPAGVVYPPQRQRWAEEHVAAAEREIGPAKLREYLPSLSDAEFDTISKTTNPYAQPAAALRRILVETEIYRRLSLDYLGRSRARLPDLTIVYFQGTDTIGHVFAPFAPPKQPQVTQSDYERFNNVPEKYFRYIDTILGEYVAIAERAHAVIVIASDHGFRWKEGRPAEISSTATATAAKWHRNAGIFVISEPRLVANPKGIRDICQILLTVTGMPALDYARYFQPAIPPPAPSTNRSSEEDVAKLRALGYIGSNESTRSAIQQNDTKTAGAYNNAGLIERNEHRIEAAIAAFERAIAIDPHYASAMWNLSETLYDAKRDLDRSDALLIGALQNGMTDAARYAISRAIAYQRASLADRSLRLLDQAIAISPATADLRLFRGRYRMDRHDCAGALEDFRMAEQSKPNAPIAWASAGFAQMCIGDAAGARDSFARARQLDPTIPVPR
ncbi:MAG: alkaline phosphatase family protein [Acidobacteriota bacterium]|nr:alkaline phosphatase family protein [Acidobacteriota bacterium]